jgi:glycosyltransferase involved in cell wall biosynthesis
MEMVLRAIFYIGALILCYIYILYPIVLIILSPERAETESTVGNSDAWPSVSVIIAAYNEEEAIASRIQNFLKTSYRGSIELLIVSDASTDRTDEIVKRYVSDKVRLIVQQGRLGKGAAINRAVPGARGDILVFTDASSVFLPETVTELVRPFRNPTVGLVNGKIHYRDTEIGNLYHRYERLLKSVEVRSGIVASVHGAVYAMRKSIWEIHDPRFVNDLYDPIVTRLKGFSVAIASDAVCVESFSKGTQFRRQVRMVALAALVLFRLTPRIVKAGEWRLLLVLMSHKLLRWMTAVWLLLVVTASVCLASAGPVFSVAVTLEAVVGFLAVAGLISERFGLSERIAFIYNFIVLNWAAMVGLWVCLRGKAVATWQPNAS